MKPIMIVFAIMMAVACAWPNEVLAQVHPLTGQKIYTCHAGVGNDPFDGEIAMAHCDQLHSDPSVTRLRIWAACKGGKTSLRMKFTTPPFMTREEELAWQERLTLFPHPYTLQDGLRLRMALDGVEITEWEWSMMEGNQRLSISPAIPVIKEMLEHDELLVRMNNTDGSARDARIHISDLREAIKPVRELCSW